MMSPIVHDVPIINHELCECLTRLWSSTASGSAQNDDTLIATLLEKSLLVARSTGYPRPPKTLSVEQNESLILGLILFISQYQAREPSLKEMILSSNQWNNILDQFAKAVIYEELCMKAFNYCLQRCRQYPASIVVILFLCQHLQDVWEKNPTEVARIRASPGFWEFFIDGMNLFVVEQLFEPFDCLLSFVVNIGFEYSAVNKAANVTTVMSNYSMTPKYFIQQLLIILTKLLQNYTIEANYRLSGVCAILTAVLDHESYVLSMKELLVTHELFVLYDILTIIGVDDSCEKICLFVLTISEKLTPDAESRTLLLTCPSFCTGFLSILSRIQWSPGVVEDLSVRVLNLIWRYTLNNEAAQQQFGMVPYCMNTLMKILSDSKKHEEHITIVEKVLLVLSVLLNYPPNAIKLCSIQNACQTIYNLFKLHLKQTKIILYGLNVMCLVCEHHSQAKDQLLVIESFTSPLMAIWGEYPGNILIFKLMCRFVTNVTTNHTIMFTRYHAYLKTCLEMLPTMIQQYYNNADVMREILKLTNSLCNASISHDNEKVLKVITRNKQIVTKSYEIIILMESTRKLINYEDIIQLLLELCSRLVSDHTQAQTFAADWVIRDRDDFWICSIQYLNNKVISNALLTLLNCILIGGAWRHEDDDNDSSLLVRYCNTVFDYVTNAIVTEEGMMTWIKIVYTALKMNNISKLIVLQSFNNNGNYFKILFKHFIIFQNKQFINQMITISCLICQIIHESQDELCSVIISNVPDCITILLNVLQCYIHQPNVTAEGRNIIGIILNLIKHDLSNCLIDQPSLLEQNYEIVLQIIQSVIVLNHIIILNDLLSLLIIVSMKLYEQSGHLEVKILFVEIVITMLTQYKSDDTILRMILSFIQEAAKVDYTITIGFCNAMITIVDMYCNDKTMSNSIINALTTILLNPFTREQFHTIDNVYPTIMKLIRPLLHNTDVEIVEKGLYICDYLAMQQIGSSICLSHLTYEADFVIVYIELWKRLFTLQDRPSSDIRPSTMGILLTKIMLNVELQRSAYNQIISISNWSDFFIRRIIADETLLWNVISNMYKVDQSGLLSSTLLIHPQISELFAIYLQQHDNVVQWLHEPIFDVIVKPHTLVDTQRWYSTLMTILGRYQQTHDVVIQICHRIAVILQSVTMMTATIDSTNIPVDVWTKQSEWLRDGNHIQLWLDMLQQYSNDVCVYNEINAVMMLLCQDIPLLFSFPTIVDYYMNRVGSYILLDEYPQSNELVIITQLMLLPNRINQIDSMVNIIPTLVKWVKHGMESQQSKYISDTLQILLWLLRLDDTEHVNTSTKTLQLHGFPDLPNSIIQYVQTHNDSQDAVGALFDLLFFLSFYVDDSGVVSMLNVYDLLLELLFKYPDVESGWDRLYHIVNDKTEHELLLLTQTDFMDNLLTLIMSSDIAVTIASSFIDFTSVLIKQLNLDNGSMTPIMQQKVERWLNGSSGLLEGLIRCLKCFNETSDEEDLIKLLDEALCPLVNHFVVLGKEPSMGTNGLLTKLYDALLMHSNNPTMVLGIVQAIVCVTDPTFELSSDQAQQYCKLLATVMNVKSDTLSNKQIASAVKALNTWMAIVITQFEPATLLTKVKRKEIRSFADSLIDICLLLMIHPAVVTNDELIGQICILSNVLVSYGQQFPSLSNNERMVRLLENAIAIMRSHTSSVLAICNAGNLALSVVKNVQFIPNVTQVVGSVLQLVGQSLSNPSSNTKTKILLELLMQVNKSIDTYKSWDTLCVTSLLVNIPHDAELIVLIAKLLQSNFISIQQLNDDEMLIKGLLTKWQEYRLDALSVLEISKCICHFIVNDTPGVMNHLSGDFRSILLLVNSLFVYSSSSDIVTVTCKLANQLCEYDAANLSTLIDEMSDDDSTGLSDSYLNCLNFLVDLVAPFTFIEAQDVIPVFELILKVSTAFNQYARHNCGAIQTIEPFLVKVQRLFSTVITRTQGWTMIAQMLKTLEATFEDPSSTQLQVNNKNEQSDEYSSWYRDSSYSVLSSEIQIQAVLDVNVYKAAWRQSTPVAIKINRGKRSQADSAIMNELQALSTLRHPRIVQVLGVCDEILIDGNSYRGLVVEFMSKATLRHVLDTENSILIWPSKLLLAVDVSDGLTFLHDSDVSHGRLSSDTVLVDNHGRAKLTGLSCMKNATFKTKVGDFEKGHDVLSFGSILWELITGKKLPWSTDSSKQSGKKRTDKLILNKQEIKGCSPVVASIMKDCLVSNLSDRPALRDIYETLHQLYMNESKRATDQSRVIPDGFICPITQDVMKDPVMLLDGHSYERKAIEDWLTRSGRSPLTNEVLADRTTLIDNYALKSAIESFMKVNPNSK